MIRIVPRFALYIVSSALVLAVIVLLCRGISMNDYGPVLEFYFGASALGLYLTELCFVPLIGADMVFGPGNNLAAFFARTVLFAPWIWPARVTMLFYQAHKAGL